MGGDTIIATTAHLRVDKHLGMREIKRELRRDTWRGNQIIYRKMRRHTVSYTWHIFANQSVSRTIFFRIELFACALWYRARFTNESGRQIYIHSLRVTTNRNKSGSFVNMIVR